MYKNMNSPRNQLLLHRSWSQLLLYRSSTSSEECPCTVGHRIYQFITFFVCALLVPASTGTSTQRRGQAIVMTTNKKKCIIKESVGGRRWRSNGRERHEIFCSRRFLRMLANSSGSRLKPTLQAWRSGRRCRGQLLTCAWTQAGVWSPRWQGFVGEGKTREVLTIAGMDEGWVLGLRFPQRRVRGS